MNNTETLTLDEQMELTIRLVKNALYENGLCGKLFTYLKHTERLMTENQVTENRKAYDLLDLFRDFMKRYKSRRLAKAEEVYMYEQLAQYQSN